MFEEAAREVALKLIMQTRGVVKGEEIPPNERFGGLAGGIKFTARNHENDRGLGERTEKVRSVS